LFCFLFDACATSIILNYRERIRFLQRQAAFTANLRLAIVKQQTLFSVSFKIAHTNISKTEKDSRKEQFKMQISENLW
jgi:hypothetical protein